MKPLVLFASTAILSAITVQGAKAAPSTSTVTPISWIVDSRHNIDVDDKRVTLVGKVIKRDDGSDWWFSDTTGSVRLDTGDRELPVGRWLVVHGRVDQARFGIGHLEVEVKHWEYAKS
jgi:uncharacterized protein YdeI (BOF family)